MRSGKRELGVVDGDDAREAIEVVGSAADAVGAAEFQSLCCEAVLRQERLTGEEGAFRVLVIVRVWEGVVTRGSGGETLVFAQGASVGANLCEVLDDGVEDVDGGGECDGGGHAGVGVAAFLDAEHLLADFGLAEPEGEDVDGDAEVSCDRQKR